MAKKVTGRPLFEIDRVEFEKLCGLHCVCQEIASFFNCDEDTLQAWCQRTYGETFSVIYKQKRGNGKVSLRRAQMELALNGNATLLIWLGKQYLDQSEKIEQHINVLPTTTKVISYDGKEQIEMGAKLIEKKED